MDLICKICNLKIPGAGVTLKVKGAACINKASELKGSSLRVHSREVVHILCRKSYLKYRNIEKPAASKNITFSNETENFKVTNFFFFFLWGK